MEEQDSACLHYFLERFGPSPVCAQLSNNPMPRSKKTDLEELALLVQQSELEEPSPIIADSDDPQSAGSIPEVLPLIPLREAVIYPMLVAPLSVSREPSVRLIDDAVASEKRIVGVVTQRHPQTEEPGMDDIYAVGCAAIIRTLVKLPDSTRLIVQGLARIRVLEIVQTEPYLQARVEVIEEIPIEDAEQEEIEALRRTLNDMFDQAVRLSPHLPDELRALTSSVNQPEVTADLVAAHMAFPIEEKQQLLETIPVVARIRLLLQFLSREVRVLELTSKVHGEVTAELSKNQRDYYLREQLKAIQRELGDYEDRQEELDELRAKIAETHFSEEARKEVEREYERLRRMNPGSPEFTVCRTFIDTMVSLPWEVSTPDQLDLDRTMDLLDQEHFGLERIKERILEFLAVRKMKAGSRLRQPILCFVGPPGVGKTSLAKSIAQALGRKLVRVQLGGVRDESEIRGHRRTYIGAMPGQVIQSLRRAGANNPVFILDEIDKLGRDFRGDPASALLEVLDPEQNHLFRDHYLDTSFDLSSILFIATANQLDTIPPALLDRMEVIELGGYTEEEKIEIAERHLVPRQIAEHGIKENKLNFTQSALIHMIRHYTREAGVRNLEREIAAVIRKATLAFARGRKARLEVTIQFVEKALGAPRYFKDLIDERPPQPGTAVGLAWTPVGGDILFIETALLAGKRGLVITGMLGDVMKESVAAALGYLRRTGFGSLKDPEFIENHEIHIHVPAGAVPKDGPSAGITLMTALASLILDKPVAQRLAMTGEVTLTGQVLPVGGIKDKVLAAHRAGVRTLILPDDNRKDYVENVPKEVQSELKVHFVDRADEVLKIALGAH